MRRTRHRRRAGRAAVFLRARRQRHRRGDSPEMSNHKERQMISDRSLEERIRAIEDRLEIYNVIASHPPSADTGGNEHIAASWVEDGVFDRGENLSSPHGREHIANQVLSAEHQA